MSDIEKGTIGIKEYEALPRVYDDDGNISKLSLKEGDYYVMRDKKELLNPGDRVPVYKVFRVTKHGDESMMITLTIV